MNYRKFYEKYYNIKIPVNWEIHHIDANRKNNDITNLIMIPKKLHSALHNYVGLLPKKDIEKIIEWYEKIKYPMSNVYLGYKLKKEVDKLNICNKLKEKNKKYITNKDKVYDNYLIKYKLKKKISDWTPKNNLMNLNNLLPYKSKKEIYNKLNDIL